MSDQSEEQAGGLRLDLEVERPAKIARWRPLVHWAMAIPVLIFAIAPVLIGITAWIVGWFAILFTGRMPVMVHNLITLWIRFHFRLVAFLFGLTTTYPPLTFSPGANDDGAQPGVAVTMPGLRAETSRVALIHSILAIPHLIVLWFLWIAFFIAGAIAWIAVLITARYPESVHRFNVKVAAWQLRVTSYVGMLYEEYPRFGL